MGLKISVASCAALRSTLAHRPFPMSISLLMSISLSLLLGPSSLSLFSFLPVAFNLQCSRIAFVKKLHYTRIKYALILYHCERPNFCFYDLTRPRTRDNSQRFARTRRNDSPTTDTLHWPNPLLRSSHSHCTTLFSLPFLTSLYFKCIG